jgi:hypothetical protein
MTKQELDILYDKLDEKLLFRFTDYEEDRKIIIGMTNLTDRERKLALYFLDHGRLYT